MGVKVYRLFREQLKELLGAELEQLGKSLEKPARIAQSFSQAIRKLEDEQVNVTLILHSRLLD